jgi:hypothetical protein
VGVLTADSLTEADGLIVPGPTKITRQGEAWIATAGARRQPLRGFC